MVRGHAGTHAGFYAPVAAMICPCKGNEPGLEENLIALTHFDYPNYEIYFALGDQPRSRADGHRTGKSGEPASGAYRDCWAGGRLRREGEQPARAVESLPEKFEAFVFTDSDVRLPRGWLAKLVAPLQDSRIGATTAYRWIIPSGAMRKRGGFASALASAWNAAVMTLLGLPGGIFAGAAARRSAGRILKMRTCWKHGAVPSATTSP